MKSINFSFAIILILLISSCKDDDKNTPLLSGKWHEQTIEIFGCTDTKSNRSLDCGTNGNYATCDERTFYDGYYTTLLVATSSSSQGRYSITGNKIKFSSMDVSSTSYTEYEFTLSGNTLTLSEVSIPSNGCRERSIYVRM